jgi:putative ABC transport system permease protein
VLAWKELLGSKLKFGLIALAIGLVVMLTMVMSAMSEGLITGMSGAKSSIAADALVFQPDTYPNLERSLLTADDLATIEAADGVRSAYGVGHSFATVGSLDEPLDVRVFGLGDRLDQLPIVEGSGDPGPGETVADVTAKLDGIELGDTVTLTPIGYDLTVVGFTENRRYVMAPTLYVSLPTWEEIHVSTVLGRSSTASAEERSRMAEQFEGGASVAAVELNAGTTVADLAEELDGYGVATPDAAAREGNGMPEMILAVGGIQWVSIVIGALLVGVFFYITTLHKTSQIAAIKAIGASSAFLYRQLVLQIVLLVTIAIVFGSVLALGMGSSMPPAMAFDPDPARWALTVLAVYVTAIVGSLFSLRNILKIDPATALGRAEQ